MKDCAIVVPVYKEALDLNEQKSFDQLLKILGKYPIVLITYKELNTFEYQQIADLNNSIIQFEYFEQAFFKSLSGYNSLCLTKNFYNRFLEYDYMLVYQLDAYVFRDELEAWCAKGYDYIGAPWFDDNRSHNDGAQLWAVGNGGFSLRKTATFIRLFETRKSAYTFKYLIKKMKQEGKSVIWLSKALMLKKENIFQYLLNEWNDAEDIFYCLKLADTRYRLKIPAISEAIDFAFEQSPEYLFQLNNNKLPFGCHAWGKYQFNSFWKNIIW